MTQKTLWQIAAGEEGRRYDDVFEQYDVMFLGPGYPGTYDPAVYRQAVESGAVTKDECERVARFVEQVSPGDYVVARRGKTVSLVGTVVDDCVHDSRFDDIFGWNVSHRRRVLWHKELKSKLEALQKDEPLYAHMKQIKTFTRADARVVEKVLPLLDSVTTREPVALSAPPPAPLTPQQLAEELFNLGVGHEAVLRMSSAFDKIRRLVSWYHVARSPGRPTEHEVVAHLILPIMIALGWSEQLLAIEWGRRDLAAFSSVPTNNEHCRLVVEAKDMWNGLQGVFPQAVGYCAELPNCNRILITNGLVNYLYFRTNGIWEEQPRYYFNLAKMRTGHTWDINMNAVKALVALTPSNVGGQQG